LIDFSEFSVERTKERAKEGTAEICATLNRNLKVVYLNGFEIWKQEWVGERTNEPAPEPPKSFVVAVDGEGWAYPSQTGPGVCEKPPLPKRFPEGLAIVIGPAIMTSPEGTWYAAGTPGNPDTAPDGFVTAPLPPDGGVYKRRRTGLGGWWLRVS